MARWTYLIQKERKRRSILMLNKIIAHLINKIRTHNSDINKLMVHVNIPKVMQSSLSTWVLPTKGTNSFNPTIKILSLLKSKNSLQLAKKISKGELLQ